MRFRLIVTLAAFMWCFILSAEVSGEGTEVCMGCHGSKDMSKTFGKGEIISLYVDHAQMQKSVHGSFGCTDCHEGFSAEDHPKQNYRNKRDYSVMFSKACTNCHADFKGIHADLINLSTDSIVCSDCHSAHAVRPVDASQESEYCLICHSKAMSITFEDGATLSLQVDHRRLAGSVHNTLACSDCHFGFSSESHPQRNFKNKRDYRIASSEVCKKCHFQQYSDSLESIHTTSIMQSNSNGAVCMDCHGAHSVRSIKEAKAMNTLTCSKCHTDTHSTFEKSVHGAARISGENTDAPICSDCHGVHKISNPRTAAFRLLVPEMCGKCHADEKLMGKYNISHSVVKTYHQEFHGITWRFYKQEEKSKRVAVCTDCHGVHDIAGMDQPNSPRSKAYLESKCRTCHPDAPENFSDSIIPHYQAGFVMAPGVFMINFIYSIFIPLMVVGLFFQILLHIWRLAVKR